MVIEPTQKFIILKTFHTDLAMMMISHTNSFNQIQIESKIRDEKMTLFIDLQKPLFVQ